MPSIVFNNDVADLIINEESIHVLADSDFYKFILPSGYSYAISSDLYDSYNSNSNSKFYYSSDGQYSYKTNTNTWSMPEDDKISDFSVPTGGTLIFKVEGYGNNSIGTYGLHIHITRATGTPSLSVSSNSITIGAAQSSTKTINITSNTNWTITNNNSWYSVSPTSGTNNAVVTITADANTKGYSMDGSFNIKANGVVTKTVSVKQPITDLVSDTYEVNNLESSAKELIVNYTGNQGKIITTGATIFPANDLDYYKINLTAISTYGISAVLHDNNSSDVDAKISYKLGASGTWSSTYDSQIPDFSYAGGDYIYFKVESWFSGDIGAYSLDITINKNTAAPTLSLSVASLTINPNENKTSTFNVTSNSGWSLTSSDPWLTLNPSSGWGNATITVQAAANTSSYSQTATITAICPLVLNQSISATQATGGFPIADSYESNDIESAAKELTLTFTNDIATFKTIGATIHSISDVDYYKIVLPAGFTYAITSRLDDSDQNHDNSYYTLDAAYSIKIGTDWSDMTDYESLNIVNGSTTVYFKVEPYNTSEVGNYAFELNISRAVSTATLSVSTSDLNFDATPITSSDFNITSSGTTWSITSNQPWLTVNTVSGTGDAKISVTALKNGNISTRSGTLTVTSKGLGSYSIYIDQAGQDANPDMYENNDTEATSFVANLAFNNDWASFCTSDANINTATDLDFYKIVLPIGYNYSIATVLNHDYSNIFSSKLLYKIGSAGTWSSPYSYGEIPTIQTDGNTELYLKVKPYYVGNKGTYEFQNSITRTAYLLSLSKATINLSNIAATSSFDITANTSWTATSSDSWLTLGSTNGTNNGTVQLSATANTSNSARVALITVAGGPIPQVITVTQDAGAATLDISATTLNIAQLAASTSTFNITSNTNWTVSSSETWLTVNTASGSYSGSITVTADANNSVNSRNAIVTVTCNGVSKTVTITQTGKTDGIDSKIVQDLKFYPNPVIDKLSIELSDIADVTTVLVYNSEGSLKGTYVQKNKSFEIDMNQYSSGVYFIKLVSSKGTQTIKVFKD